jgi:hypothetical protein
MDKQKAHQMFELASRLINLDASTLSEQQLQQRNDMIFKLKEEIKMLDEASLATMRDYFAGNEKAHDPFEITKQRLHFAKDKNAKPTIDKRFRSPEEYQAWLKQHKLTQISSVNEDDLDVTEDTDGEYNDEAGMAKSGLQTMSRAVSGLMDTIDEGDNLPEWAQEKLSLAEDYLTTVWDYLLSQKEQGIEPKLESVDNGMPKDVKNKGSKLTPVEMKKTEAVSEEINTEAYERLQKVFAFKNYES